jgi:hypothetical protein
MDWYVIVKVINGHRYRYRQKTWRVGNQVRCSSHYLGRCNTTVRGYHGTFAKFYKFEESKVGSATGGADTDSGFFFASNPRVAISYASTELAARRGLDTRIRTLEARIEALTGMEWRVAEEQLEEGGYAHDKAIESKLKTYLQRRERAEGRLQGGMFEELELSKRGHLKECRITIKDAYYFDNENRRCSPWTYLKAIEKARELGCDGVVIKNTYDMGTPSLSEKDEWYYDFDDITDVYIVFSSEQIVTTKRST